MIEEAFRDLHGRTLNFNSMVQAVGKLNRWYEEKGVLGQVRGGGGGGGQAGVWVRGPRRMRTHACSRGQPYACLHV